MTPATTPTLAAASAATVAAKRDRWTYFGILAVALAAAVLSFASLTGLAELAGVTGAAFGVFPLAWLLPIAIDAYALTATRVWLRTGATARTRTYARRCAIGAIVLSVAGNAAYHALTASGVGGLLAVAVSAVPPVMLGLVGHMHALVSADYRAPATTPPAAMAPSEETTRAGQSRPTATTASAGTGSPPTTTPRRRKPTKRDAAASGAEAVMRDYWATERAAGRTPSGAALDRVAGTRDYGRKVRRALLAEEAQTATATTETTNETGTGTAPDPDASQTETSGTASESGKGLMRV